MARPPLSGFIWLLCFSFLSSTRAEDAPCTGHHAGKYYDLNRLQIGKDYTLTTPGGHDMVLSACKSVSHETWGLKVQDPGLVGGFVRRDHGDFSMGQTNTTLSFSGRAGHPHITLASGSKCLDSNGNTIENLKGSTEMEFICDPSSGAGTPRLVAQLPPGTDNEACAWFIEWRTAAACPTSEGLTFGGIIWFLFISALVLLLFYLVLGTVYNYFILHLSGTDALPRFSLAGMLYHGREAWDLANDWWASGRASGKFTFSSTQGSGGGARGPVGLGGPGGFTSRPDIERAGSDDGSFTRGDVNATNGNGNPFVRTSVRKERAPQAHPQPQRTALNPASHQTQVMAPTLNDTTAATENPASGAGAGVGGVEMGAGGVGAIGINPASHQAQLMMGMPVPHLFSNSTPSPNSAAQPNQDTQYRDAPPVAAVPPPTPGRQTFAVGDDEGDDEEGAGGEVQIAELRGRMGAEGEGVIRL